MRLGGFLVILLFMMIMNKDFVHNDQNIFSVCLPRKHPIPCNLVFSDIYPCLNMINSVSNPLHT